MSLEPDEKELEKIRRNKARAEKEFMDIAPIIEGKKYVESIEERIIRYQAKKLRKTRERVVSGH